MADLDQQLDRIARYHAHALRVRLQEAEKFGWMDVEEVCRLVMLDVGRDAAFVCHTGYLPAQVERKG